MSRKRRGKRSHNNMTQDSIASPSGAGSDADRGEGYYPVGSIAAFASEFRHTGINIYDFLYGMRENTWEAKKIVEIVPFDMTREGWKYEGQDVDVEQIKLIEKEEARLDVVKVFAEALEYERLYGGAVILLGTAEVPLDIKKISNNNIEAATLPLKPESIEKGGLVFLRAIPRPLVTPLHLDFDLLSENYGKADLYSISGHSVHRSRLLIFDGGGDRSPGTFGSSASAYARDGFGSSVLLPLITDIISAVGGRKAMFHLVNMYSIPIFKELPSGGQASSRGSKGDALKLEKLKHILKQMSIYRGVILDKGFDLTSFNSKMSDLPKYSEFQLQVLSAGSDIVAARFIGQAPGGLNATGTSDLVNYYDSIKSNQTLKLKPNLERLKPYLVKSATGMNIESITIKFNPLMQLSDDQQADLRGKDWKNMLEAFNSGDVTWEWLKKESKERNIFLNDLEKKIEIVVSK